MAIPQLSEHQIQTMSLEEKDRWWLANVFRGDMPQLTIRSAITGFILGGLLSATNLYIGAKTGWTLGVGLTSVILAFAMFKALSAIRLAKDFTILENNAMQSIATSAGYMTGPLISGLAAYMMVQNQLMSWWQMMLFNVVLSILGVLVAFPMKRRFINDEQAPFPEGAACGVVLDTLYTSDAKVGIFKAKALVFAGLFAGFLKLISGEAYQKLLQGSLLGRDHFWFVADHWYKHLVDKGYAIAPRVFKVDLVNKMGLSPTLDLAMLGAGGLMGIRYAVNMFIGMLVAYAFVGPLAVHNGWVLKKGATLTAETVANRNDVLNGWLLWPGVGMLVCASLTAFFAKPQVIITAFKGLLPGGKKAGGDVLKHIEFPLWISAVGIPIVGAMGVWMAHDWFGVVWYHGALAIALIILLTLIAVNATAATSITPTGSLSKITQMTFGVLNPQHAATNLMTATMTTEVASNAANLLMDIKPGYMLGAKPRQQAIGHCIGIFAGALASTPLFFIMFLAGRKGNVFTPYDERTDAVSIQQHLQAGLDGSKDQFTAAVQWKGISDFISALTGGKGITSVIHPTALTALVVAAIAGVVFELVRVFTKNKSPFSPVAFALGVVIPPDSTLWMFLGSLFFWGMTKVYHATSEEPMLANASFGKKLWVGTREPICAGLIAGAALTGIGDTLIQAFVF